MVIGSISMWQQFLSYRCRGSILGRNKKQSWEQIHKRQNEAEMNDNKKWKILIVNEFQLILLKSLCACSSHKIVMAVAEASRKSQVNQVTFFVLFSFLIQTRKACWLKIKLTISLPSKGSLCVSNDGFLERSLNVPCITPNSIKRWKNFRC